MTKKAAEHLSESLCCYNHLYNHIKAPCLPLQLPKNVPSSIETISVKQMMKVNRNKTELLRLNPLLHRYSF